MYDPLDPMSRPDEDSRQLHASQLPFCGGVDVLSKPILAVIAPGRLLPGTFRPRRWM